MAMGNTLAYYHTANITAIKVCSNGPHTVKHYRFVMYRLRSKPSVFVRSNEVTYNDKDTCLLLIFRKVQIRDVL
jgi:hypothetical protein